MQIFNVLLIFLFCTSAMATDCKRHPLYCQILSNKPKINKRYALKLSNIIHKAAIKHEINAQILTAILAQESMYNLKTKNCSKGIVEVEIDVNNCFASNQHLMPRYEPGITVNEDYVQIVKFCRNKRFKVKEVCMDYGIAQINYKTAAAFDLDMHRLTEDLKYSVNAGAIILADFRKRFKKREPHNYWTRYNTSSPLKRKKYKNLVNRYYENSNK